MSASDEISSQEGSQILQLEDNQLNVQQTLQSGQDMEAWLRQYGPQFNVEGVQSELELLSDMSSFQQYVERDKLNFNYNFNYDSWSYYSRLQNVVRIELTKFRRYLKEELERRRERIDFPGYYYDLGARQDSKYRPDDFYEPKEGKGDGFGRDRDRDWDRDRDRGRERDRSRDFDRDRDRGDSRGRRDDRDFRERDRDWGRDSRDGRDRDRGRDHRDSRDFRDDRDFRGSRDDRGGSRDNRRDSRDRR